MTRTVAQALDDAAAGQCGFVFVSPDGREAEKPFKELRDSALDLGGALRARGLDRGDYVAIVIPDADGFLAAFLGASAAGLVPMPLAHPHDVTQLDAYLDTVVPLFRVAGARAVVTTPRLLPLLSGLQAAAPTIRFVTSWTELTGPALPKSEQTDIEAPALLQFTSGSTSQPKGVVLTHANIAANVQAIGGPAGPGKFPDDIRVSWPAPRPRIGPLGPAALALCFRMR